MPNHKGERINIPEWTGKIYRYLSLNDKDREDLEFLCNFEESGDKSAAKTYLDIVGLKKDHRLAYLFRNFKLFRSMPLGLNDPYDCLVEIDPNTLDTHLLLWFRHYYMLQSYDPVIWQVIMRKIDSSELNNYLKDSTNTFQSDSDKQNITYLVKKTLQTYVNQARVICFSEIPDNILMWAHYADKHEGYCLEFNCVDPKISGFVGLYSVKYPKSDLRPLIDFSLEEWKKFGISRKTLLVKSSHWKYEKEIRMINPSKEEYFQFEPPALEKIILGSKMPDRYKKGFKFLISILNKKKSLSHINFLEASLDPKYFKVNIPK